MSRETCVPVRLYVSRSRLTQERRDAIPESMNKRRYTHLQGHRGARGLAPENTLAGFAATLEIGVDGIEFDVGMSRDDHIVICHDLRLNPDIFRDQRGDWVEAPGTVVNELSLDELRKYDAGRLRPGSAYATRYPQQRQIDGERIPTLTEFVELANRLGYRDFVYNIEVKVEPDHADLSASPERFAEILVAKMHELDIVERSVVQSFWWDLPVAVQKIDGTVATSCLSSEQSWGDNILRHSGKASAWTRRNVNDFDGSVGAMAADAGATVWAPYFAEITQDSVTDAQAMGLQVIPWTVNEKSDMKRLMQWGVDGIISDYPNHLRDVAESEGQSLP